MESAVKWISVCHLTFITQHQRPAFGQLGTLSSHITPLARCFPKAHGLWPHHFGLWFHHILQTVKGLDSTWMRSGVNLDWIQSWFNKIFPPLLLLLFLYLSGLCILSRIFLSPDPDSFCFPKYFSPLPYPNVFLPLSFQCFLPCCTYISLKPACIGCKQNKQMQLTES